MSNGGTLTPWQEAPEQAVILVGATPRFELDADRRLILEYLIETCWRFGFLRILLLAGSQPGWVAAAMEVARAALPNGCAIDLGADPAPFGTAGALRRSADRLEERFLLLDGDSVLDTNWLDLMLATRPEALAVMTLRRSDAATMDGGVCLVDRRIVAHLPRTGSLKRTVLPVLAARGLVCGRVQDGLFLDLHAPDGSAQTALPQLRRRPAVFFDRDGTLNADAGYTHKPQDLVFLPAAIAAVKRVNDLGYYAFLVTNQSGVARGYFTEADVAAFHAHLQRKLRAAGAHLDDIRFCADHPDATVPRYRRMSDWRKPGPGMLRDLMQRWPVEPAGSLVVGDKESDIEAGKAAGLRGLLYTGGNLDDCLKPQLRPRRTA
jgi:D,D-heptose 1,7-bisphosphate phosphatase